MLFLQLSLFFLFGTSAFALFDLNDFLPAPPPLPASAPAPAQNPPQAPALLPPPSAFTDLVFHQISVSISSDAHGFWSRKNGETSEIMRIWKIPGQRVERYNYDKISLKNVRVGTEDLTPAYIVGDWIRCSSVSGPL